MQPFLKRPISQWAHREVAPEFCTAAKFLDDWCQQVMRSRIEPMKKVDCQLILNYFGGPIQQRSATGRFLTLKKTSRGVR
jgi:hypothetical protein